MVSRFDKLLRETMLLPSLREAHSVRERDVEILVGADADRVLVRSAVALALRCFDGGVTLQFTSAANTGLLRDAEEEAASYGKRDRISEFKSPSPRAIRLGLSCLNPGGVVADASGWLAGVNRIFPSRLPPAAPAAAFAVACAFGKVFASLQGAHATVIEEEWTLSLLDLDESGANENPPLTLDLGRIILLGAGAIGSAFAFILRLSGWGGRLTVVDKETYEELNHETTFLISRSDAMSQRPKALTISSLARREGLCSDFLREEIDEGSALLSERADAFVCAVDNAETRRCLDRVNVATLLNAGVGGSREDSGHVLWTRHDVGEVVLSSVYREREDVPETRDSSADLPTEVASEPCSRLPYESVALAAPFIALAAAALLTAGVAHQAMGRKPNVNFLKLDLLALQSKYVREYRRNSSPTEST